MKEANIPQFFLSLMPAYIEGYGSGVEIVNIDGTSMKISKSLKSILNYTLRIYAVDIKAVKNKYAISLGIKNSIPIPLAQNFTLVQMKVRVPVIEKDNAYGYINYEKVKNIEDFGTYCMIDLGCIKIKVFQKKTSVERHLRNASMMKAFFYNLKTVPENYSSTMYNLPATKADILMLYEEIAKIKYKIEKL